MEKCGKFWKNGRFSGRIWPDWGNTARADMAGLGSKGLILVLLWKNVEKYEKLPFFPAATDGLGKYRMGGYGLIGVCKKRLETATTIPAFAQSRPLSNKFNVTPNQVYLSPCPSQTLAGLSGGGD